MISLADKISNLGIEIYYLVVDSFLDIRVEDLSNFHVIYAYSGLTNGVGDKYFCLEDRGRKLEEKNSGRLLADPLTLKYIKETSVGRKVMIVPFKNSARIEKIARDNGFLVAANPVSYSRLLEDKIKFSQKFEGSGIRMVPFVIGRFNENEFLSAIKKWGSKIVVQTHFGWAGNSSIVAQDWQRVKDWVEKETVVKYSPYLKGYTLINNGCITKKGLIQSPVGIQFNGIEKLSSNPLATVGRQWPSGAPKQIDRQVRKMTVKFADKISLEGYRGYFGLDFIVCGDKVYLLECNPRLTASLSLYYGIEKRAGYTPLFYFHLAEFLDLESDYKIEDELKREEDPRLEGGELTRKNEDGVTVARYRQYHKITDGIDSGAIKQEIISKV